jgi:uncharacterized protein
MIKCTNDDKLNLFDYLKERPAENCFFIGDVENFDLNEPFLELWRPEKELNSLLMRYYKFFSISAIDDVHLEEMANIIKCHSDCILVNGLEYYIDKIQKFIEFKKVKVFFLADLRKETFRKINSTLSCQKAKIEDIDELFDFQKGIKEFELDEESRENFGKEIRTNTGKTYFIKEQGKIVSSATITAENSLNGMIIGVATAEEYRGRGYAQASVSRICEEMITENKRVVLFYNNPDAGKLYKKIGFVDVEKWAMGRLKE